MCVPKVCTYEGVPASRLRNSTIDLSREKVGFLEIQRQAHGDSRRSYNMRLRMERRRWRQREEPSNDLGWNVDGGGRVDTNVNQGWEITDKGGRGEGGWGKPECQIISVITRVLLAWH